MVQDYVNPVKDYYAASMSMTWEEDLACTMSGEISAALDWTHTSAVSSHGDLYIAR